MVPTIISAFSLDIRAYVKAVRQLVASSFIKSRNSLAVKRAELSLKTLLGERNGSITIFFIPTFTTSAVALSLLQPLLTTSFDVQHKGKETTSLLL